jgi:NADPH:quinone reductase-like Zn-dependent oxidoreductase
MKAIVQDEYGPAKDVLALQDIDQPVVKDDEVLVDIQASSIHIGDYYVLRGVPKIMRPVFGLRRPKHRVPGTDIAGIVEAVGAQVTQFKAGDEVYGWCHGGFAEYVSTSESQLSPKPASLTFEQAAAVPTSALTALQAIRDHGKVQAGQKVLVVGASGGVGTYAVQIAKSLGAEVTGVCSTRNVALVSSIGADRVIDYTQEDFTQGEQRFDLIFDNVGAHSLSDTRRALTPDGTLLANGAPVGGWVGGLGHVLRAALSSIVVRQQGRPFVSVPNAKGLAALTELIEAGKIQPVIDRTYPLAETSEAMSRVGEGHAQGKTVISVRGSDDA